MSMIADGDSGPGKVFRMARRPAIRARAITPPRAASPASTARTRVQLPIVRPPARHRLQLVTDDDANEALHQAAHAPQTMPPPAPTGAERSWSRVSSRPLVLVMVAAAAALVAFATLIAVRSVSRANEDRPGTTTLTSSLQATPENAATPIAPAEPAIPVVDVNSLPTAR
jgi:hypothetical protein